jgi:O-antigen/teichoic acid export membrane protein
LARAIEPPEEEPQTTGAEPGGEVQPQPTEGHRLGRTIVSGTIWSTVARIGMLLFGLVTQGLLARLLEPGDFGRYSLLLSLAGSVALICQFGLPQSTLRAVARANSEGRGLARGVIIHSARLALAAAGVGALLVLWPFGRIIAGFFPKADLQAVVGFFAVLAAIRILENIAPELFRGIKDFRGSSLFGGLLAALALAVFSAAYLQFKQSATLAEALILTITSAGLTLVLGAAVLGRKVRSMPANAERAKVSGLLNRALWLGTIFNYSITQLDLWVVGAMGSPDDVALYAAAFRLSMLITIPLSIVNFVVPPLVVELLHRGDKERLGRTVQTVATVAGGPAFLGLLLFIAFGGFITQLVYGGFYAAAGIPLAILSVGKLSSVLSGPCGTTLIMAGGQKESLRILALNFVVTLPMQIAGMHYAGLPGLAAATTLGFVIQQVHLGVAVKRRIGVGTHFNIRGTYRLLREISREDLKSLFRVKP